MKKIFLLSVLSVLITNIVSAEIILAPQWSEICPKSYLDAKH